MAKRTIGLLQMLADYFSDYLPNVKGLSENSIISYQYAFQLLFEFLGEEKKLPPEKTSFKNLTDGTVAEYLNWLESKRKCSAKTRNLRRAALSSFSKYAFQRNIGEAAAFFNEVKETPKKKIPKNDDIKYFTREEISILLGLPNTSSTIGYRDAVLMSVLYASGARAQEICDLTANDVVFGIKTSIRLTGKGNKARRVTIPENCAALLKGYMECYGMTDKAEGPRVRHIFSSQINEHMSVSCVEGIMKKYVRQAKERYPDMFKQNSYSPHSMRHSIAVHMLESGVPIPVIRVFLGHVSISSTMAYATMTSELANKYLGNRVSAFDSVEVQRKNENILNALPFLKKNKSSNG